MLSHRSKSNNTGDGSAVVWEAGTELKTVDNIM
jgi:hypothetical protein